MNEALERRAEILKLARLLGREPAQLGYLEEIPASSTRELREQATEMLFTAHEHALRRLAAASRLLPVGLVAVIAERAFGPMLAARIAGYLDPDRAIEVAAKLPIGFLADVAVDLDPRRASDVIAGIPVDRVAEITRELRARQEYVAMGRFVGHLGPESLARAIGELDEAALLRTAFVMEHKQTLDSLVELLAPDELAGLIAIARADDLWEELLELFNALGTRTQERLVEPVSRIDPGVRKEVLERARAADVLDQLGPLRAALEPGGESSPGAKAASA